MTSRLSTLVGLALLTICSAKDGALIKLWMQKEGHTDEQRVIALIAEMTFQEKVMMLHGSSLEGYVGHVPGNDRLGIPPLNLNDGYVYALVPDRFYIWLVRPFSFETLKVSPFSFCPLFLE